MAEINRIAIGLEGHQTYEARISEEEYKRLRDAIEDDNAKRWHLLKTLESEVILDLSKVVYMSLASQEHRVGFQARALDRRLYILFRTVAHSRRAERAVERFSKLGEHGLLWQGIALTGAALDPDRRGRWVRAWASIAGAFGANQAIKFAVRRPRPELPGLPPLTKTMSQLSYPSAHATTSAAGARVLSEFLPPAALYPLAVAMATSRLYLGVHWPSDTLAGFALGTAVAELAQ